MYRISRQQMKAARALLEFNQENIATTAGITVPMLSNYESGKSTLQERNFRKLVHTYELFGIVFTQDNGVKMRPSSEVFTLQGIDGFRSFMDDVYATSRDTGGQVCLYNSKPSLWPEYLGKEWYDMHAERMKALEENISVRIILQKGETDHVLGMAQHRHTDRITWNKKITYVYGNKIAFLDFSNDDIFISVMNNKEFAEGFQIMFDALWEQCNEF